MLNDWKEMCPLAFKARWFGTPEEKQLMDIGDLPHIRWGSYFEQLVLGSGVGGKLIELTDKELRSEYYPRVKRQAEIARDFVFRHITNDGHKIPMIGAQIQVKADMIIEGVKVPVEGNIDAAFGRNKIPELNLDTKYTGDTTNTYGKYAWGKPETMNMGQLINYSELTFLIYGVMPRSMYYVADSTPKERVEIIEPIFSDYSRDLYKWELKEAYVGISYAVKWNVWVPTPEYNKCKNCPLYNQDKASKEKRKQLGLPDCPSAIKVPQIKVIQK